MTYAEIPTSARRALRLLLTDRCNIRCTFCHNEFQGDTVPGKIKRWDEALVVELLTEFSLHNFLRVKFSGGEPLLQWAELQHLLRLSRAAGARDMTLFSNLTLASDSRLLILARAGVERIHTNLPSFDPSHFIVRTGQPYLALNSVLNHARSARTMNIRVQFNLVVPAVSPVERLHKLLEAELHQAATVADSWDALAFIADARGARPFESQHLVHELLAAMPGMRYADARVLRGDEFHWCGKSIFASRCTDWSEASDLAEADTYVLPPGRLLSIHTIGRAYRE